MRRLLQITLLAFLAARPALSCAQKAPVVRPNQVKIAPARALDFFNTGIEAGYQRQTGRRLATLLTGALMTDVFGLNYNENFKGLRLSLEEKYFLSSHPEQRRRYLSAEGVYYRAAFDRVAFFGPKNSRFDTTAAGYPPYMDSISVKKRTAAFNIKGGMEFRLRGLVIDICAGLGIKYRGVVHSGRINPGDEMARPRHPNVDYMNVAEGKGFTGSIPVNIRIGFAF